MGIEIKFYNLYTFKKQVDANCIDLDSEFVDLNYIVASLIFCHFRRNIPVGTVLPKSTTGAFSSNSRFDVDEVKTGSVTVLSRYFGIKFLSLEIR